MALVENGLDLASKSHTTSDGGITDATAVYPDFSSGPLTFFHGNMAALRRELQVKFEMEAFLPPLRALI